MVSRQVYRDGMARFAAAVHIATTDGPSGITGFTASAACSVTDDPPTLLICLNRASGLHSTFLENAVFCLNTLAADQQEFAELFAHRRGTPMKERFTSNYWDASPLGSPRLKGALMTFDCRIIDAKELGTHWVIFGEVEDLRHSRKASALLYLHRGYRILPLQDPETT